MIYIYRYRRSGEHLVLAAIACYRCTTRVARPATPQTATIQAYKSRNFEQTLRHRPEIGDDPQALQQP